MTTQRPGQDRSLPLRGSPCTPFTSGGTVNTNGYNSLLKTKKSGGSRRSIRRSRYILLGLSLFLLALAVLAPISEALHAPLPAATSQNSLLLYSDGQTFSRLRPEEPVTVARADLPDFLINAVVSIEDHRFFSHSGVDFVAIARAIAVNARHLQIKEGGSTLTMQLARVRYALNPRSLWIRKAREWVLAIHLESQMDKTEIAVAYLNAVNLCADGVAGISHAAWHLFGVSPKQLSKAQSAMLAGLIQQPTSLSPWRNLKGAVNRQHVVLRRMRTAGNISATEERTIRAEQTNLQPRKRTLPSPDPVVTTLRQHVQHLHIDVDPTVRAFTTLHEGLQKAARTAASRIKRAQTAIVALDAKTGAVLAMMGRRPSSRSQFNRATNARRPVGSLFKPFVTSGAIEAGFSPSETIPLGPWRPGGNCSPTPLTPGEMLVRSDNCAAAGLVSLTGAKLAADVAERVGFHSFPAVPSIALGTGEATPLEVAAAFSAFATVSLGKVPVPYMIAKVKRGDETIFAATPKQRDAIRPEVAQVVSDMLGEVVQRGTARAVSRLPINVVGKTGTSDGSHDAWFAGVVDGRIVVVVWVGYDRPSNLGANAADIAVPVWMDFISRALRTSVFTPRQAIYVKQSVAN